MPEGDTIHQIASYLAPRLVGKQLKSGSLREEPGLQLAGESVASVRPRGKHLLVDFADGRSVRSHLGMYGSWHRYAPDETWRLPRSRASLVLETDRDVLVCFRAKEVELLEADGARRRAFDRRVGPDLTAEPPDIEAILERVRREPPTTPMLDLLLDQRVASGIGNVYKSELLFLRGIDPLTPRSSVPDGELRELYRLASQLLRANAAKQGTRVTRPDGAAEKDSPLWVYGRAGKACWTCGDTIMRERNGRHRRGTYWCPTCQG